MKDLIINLNHSPIHRNNHKKKHQNQSTRLEAVQLQIQTEDFIYIYIKIMPTLNKNEDRFISSVQVLLIAFFSNIESLSLIFVVNLLIFIMTIIIITIPW